MIEDWLAGYQERVEGVLERALPRSTEPPQRLHEAMRYAALDAGKRLRPALVYLAGEAMGAERDNLDGAAAAVECIHCYSLVHDDLPAMDDDALRRGRPTCHRAFDEATAILAGDALQSLAFQILAEDARLADDRRSAMITTLAAAAGAAGMAGGQALDLASEGRAPNRAELETMHRHKTGALIRACVRLGVLAAPGASDTDRECLDTFAAAVGLAFQVQDDVLDITGETAMTGKISGGDNAQDKATFPALLGLDGARDYAHELRDHALAALDGYGNEVQGLRELAEFIVARNH
jgi:geranylgeranyl pyrophosphate synthase